MAKGSDALSCSATRAVSPRLRGEGRGEGPLGGHTAATGGAGSLPLTRKPRRARLPTSPRKRGEVIGLWPHNSWAYRTGLRHGWSCGS